MYCVDFLWLILQYIHQWFRLIFLLFVFWLTSYFYSPVYLFLIRTNFFFCSLRASLETLLWTAVLPQKFYCTKQIINIAFFTWGVFIICIYFTYYITGTIGWQLLVIMDLLISESMKKNITFYRNHRWICDMSRSVLCDQICHRLAWFSITFFPEWMFW